MLNKHRAKVTALITATAFWVALPAGVMAQGTLDRFLSSVEVSSAGKCNRIDIRLHRPASYVGHFPISSGTELVVRVQPLGTEQSPDEQKIPLPESANVLAGNAADLNSVGFDATTSGGAVIRLAFGHAVSFRVVMDAESRHIRVDESEKSNAASCLGLSKSEGNSDVESNVPAKTDAPSAGTDSIAAGKKALAAKDYAHAVGFFTKAVTDGNASAKQEGQELLGLARERAGQLAHAKAEYETYLKLYPKGAGAARVRQRLSGVEAAEQDAAEAQFSEHNKSRLVGAVPDNNGVAKGPGNTGVATTVGNKGDSAVTGGPAQPESNLGAKVSKGEPAPDPNAWIWEKNGSISQYYYRDDIFSASDILRGSLGTHETLQNEVISSGDFYLRGENQIFDLSMRGATFNESGFGKQSDVQETNISTIYAEAKHKPSGLFTRLGRQSRSTGGVFGRFDGANVGWEVNKDLKLQTVVGSPVFSRNARPFADDRLFYGASIDYTFPNQEWAGALYAIEQDVGSVLDRRALGAELRYTGKEMFVYSAMDYDVFYEELNSAYVSGTWNFKEGASIYGTLDYRHSPFLLTSNALMGQSVQELSSLVDLLGEDEVYSLALDRTAYSQSAMVGLSYPLSEQWQAAIDATIANYSGTPTSVNFLGTILATPDPGIEVYLSGQLTGTGIFTENDSVAFGLRYSENDTSRLYLGDLSVRYPFSENLRINPRLRLSLRDGKTSDIQQLLVMPSLGLRYRMSEHWNFEVEVGMRWENDWSPGGNDQNTELLLNAGYRYEF